ncbi:uncharacterized protein ATC70_008584 [Mucor velutinosus]|uniref:Uncharacterized protein n=1 Tax=Mucor velutinosus TaxID=708070 RepID=A0AAN7DQ54_9FUNG|nr:hypothetical protein ATC70_008584 [Mucor velutinosus]
MAGFPSWAIALVLITVITMASSAVYVIFKKRVGKKRTTVGTQEGSILEKNIGSYQSSSAYPVKPLVQQFNHDASTSTFKNNSNATIPLPSALSPPYTYTSHLDEKGSLPPPVSSVPVKDDNASSVWTDGIKINLPMPPPSSSFFADKMELDSIEANDIYNAYLTQQQEYVSIDLDDPKPFLSSAAATLQQKTATIRSTLRQSMRRKSTSNKSGSIAPLNQLFDTMSNNTSASSIRSPTKSSAESTRMSRQSSSTSSRFPRSLTGHSTPSLPTSGLPPPSPRPDSPLEYFNRNSSKKSSVRHEPPEDAETHSNKIMIDTIPPESYFSLPMSPSTPSPLGLRAAKASTTPVQSLPKTSAAMDTDYSMVHEINTYDIDQEDEDSHHSNQEEEEPEEEEEPTTTNTGTPLEAASAARKVIRSASRKSRTRSMIITDEAAQVMFSSFANDQIPSTPTSSSVSKYATLRGANKKNPYDIALDIKSWTSIQSKTTETSPDSPNPKRTLMSSNISGSATVSGKRAIKLQQSSISHQGGSSDNLLAGRKDTTTPSDKSRTTSFAASPKSLKSLFSRPSQDSIVQKDQQVYENSDSIVIPSSARTSLSIVITDIHHLESSTQQESAPGSPITMEPTSPYSSNNNTLRKMGNNVDTIIRMLQSSWSGNNLKESGSNHSLSSSSAGDRTSSYMGSVGSSYKPVASPLGSVNPRLQNQHLVSLSLKASTSQAARSRPSMPIGFMNEDGSLEGGGEPAPTASFSSSTVRTMIPAEEVEGDQSRLKMQEKKSTVSGLLGSRQQNKLHQPSRLGNNRKQVQQTGKTPAQKEREKYLKSLKA